MDPGLCVVGDGYGRFHGRSTPNLGENEGVYMSVEVITMLGVGVSILLAIGGACGWMIHRMDRIEGNLGSRIDGSSRLRV